MRQVQLMKPYNTNQQMINLDNLQIYTMFFSNGGEVDYLHISQPIKALLCGFFVESRRTLNLSSQASDTKGIDQRIDAQKASELS
jgi:hypothetical protein